MKFLHFILCGGIVGIIIEICLYPIFLSSFLKDIPFQNKVVNVILATIVIFSIGMAIFSWIYFIWKGENIKEELKSKWVALIAPIICLGVLIGWIGLFGIVGILVAILIGNMTFGKPEGLAGIGYVFLILFITPISAFCGLIWGIIQSRNIVKWLNERVVKLGMWIIFALALVTGGGSLLYFEWDLLDKPHLFELQRKLPFGNLVFSVDKKLYMLTHYKKTPKLLSTAPSFSYGYEFGFKFSPTGKYVSFITFKEKELERTGCFANLSVDLRLWIMEFDGNNKRVVSSHYAEDPAWSNDEILLVFSSKRKDTNNDGMINCQDNSDICLINLLTNELKWLSNTDEISEEYPIFSPDGQKVVFLTLKDYPTLYTLGVINVDGTNRKQLTSHTIWANKELPAWAPDSKKIVYVSNGIWKVDIMTEKEIQLSTIGSKPIWSPDGNKIIFKNNNDIWIMDSDGKNQKSLTEKGDVYSSNILKQLYVWSPDSSKIAFWKEMHWLFGTQHRIWVMDSNGKNKKLIFKPKKDGKLINWMP
ncbi:MAG: DPP IV N-terminal domain-containing protein [bacterium]